MAVGVELETAGSVWRVLVKAGDVVVVGQALFIMEVMKMEVPYEAPVSGKVEKINFAEGDVVEEGFVALEIGVTGK